MQLPDEYNLVRMARIEGIRIMVISSLSGKVWPFLSQAGLYDYTDPRMNKTLHMVGIMIFDDSAELVINTFDNHIFYWSKGYQLRNIDITERMQRLADQLSEVIANKIIGAYLDTINYKRPMKDQSDD